MMDSSTEYSYMLPGLSTEGYLLLMFALNKCKDDISYGFRIKPLIKKIQDGVIVTARDPSGKGPGHGE